MDQLNAYCPILITHPVDHVVFGEVSGFFASAGSISFVLRMSNGVEIILQPCARDYASRVEYALVRGGHPTVHPCIPVMSIEGQLIPLRIFFCSLPFTRSNLVECGLTAPNHTRDIPTTEAVDDAGIVPVPAAVVHVSADASDQSDNDDLGLALNELRDAILAKAAEHERTRDERVTRLRAERDRLRTWAVGDTLSTLTAVVLRPQAPSRNHSKWTTLFGIFLPALEVYSRNCTGTDSLTLQAAYEYNDVARENRYIDACAALTSAETLLPHAWSCGDGQYLMWRADGPNDEFDQEALCIETGISIPVSPPKLGVKVSLCPPMGAKSAIIVRVALGRCANSPSNASTWHHSSKCDENTYMVFCASRVLPAFRVLFM